MTMWADLQAGLARFLVRGILQSTDDSASLTFQRIVVRGLAGEVFDDVQFMQPYGLASNPEDGAQVALFEVGGARDHLIALLIADEANRPKNLNKGETALHGKGYVAVRAKVNGDVVIEGSSGNSVITVDAAGNVTITGTATITLGPATTIDSKLFLTHTHSGVTAGGGSTGGVE